MIIWQGGFVSFLGKGLSTLSYKRQQMPKNEKQWCQKNKFMKKILKIVCVDTRIYFRNCPPPHCYAWISCKSVIIGFVFWIKCLCSSDLKYVRGNKTGSGGLMNVAETMKAFRLKIIFSVWWLWLSKSRFRGLGWRKHWGC